jgi:hypothetical protein
MRAWIAAVVVAALAVGSAAPAAAQPRRQAGGAAGVAERREQVKKRIRAMRAYTLTEELALDDQTAGKLFPVLARYDDETDKLLERRADVQRRLRRPEGLRDPRLVDRLIDEALANQRGLWDLEDRKIGELRKILTPAQTVKLLVVLPAFDRRIQNQLRKAIAQGRPGAAADEMDDDVEPDEAPPRKPPRPRREGPLAPRPSSAPGNTVPCDPATGPCR